MPGLQSTSSKRDYLAVAFPRSEVVGSTQADITRLGVIGSHAVGFRHLLRANFILGIALQRLQFVEDVEDIQAESQLMVREGRTILHAQIQALGPRLATGITRTRRLATAVVVGRLITHRVAYVGAVVAQAALGHARGDAQRCRRGPLVIEL